MAARTTSVRIPGPRRTAAAVALALALCTLTATSCSVIRAAKKVTSTVEGNKSTIDAFSKSLNSTPSEFEATYVTTGSSPATVVYAVRPPKELVFKQTPTARSGSSPGILVVVNSTGEFGCTPATSSGGKTATSWSCAKLAPVAATTQNAIFDFYTPAHWVAFLRDFSLAAGFAGDKVSSSTKTVNGFAMKCVDFQAPGEPGTSSICTTSQGILGYVKVAADTTSFAIKAYSTKPPAALFALPRGAKITTVQLPSSSPSS